MSYVFLLYPEEMEEIIQILIFVGAMVIAVIGQNAKNKKKPMTASPKEVLEDMFPEITLQEEENAMPPTRQPVPERKRTSVKKQPIPPPAAPERRKETSKQEKKISLSQKSEAKRAFIYSEIFNRKY